MPSSGPKPRSLILTLSCPDQVGIVSSVSSWLATGGFNIRDSAQFGDDDTHKFFMRVWAEEINPPSDAQHNSETAQREWVQDVAARFQKEMADKFKMEFQIHGKEEKPRTLIMVSKIGHCLNDLLFRLKAGTLPISVPLIVSNHAEYKSLAEQHGIPFYHLPISAAEGKTKEWQEEQIVKLCDEHKVELVVLARYMQILSPKLCELMSGRIINIHHSFLPSFKGAKPYHQAYERGVKIIGATAHIVTSDLDEGPIIEQNVERVNHNHSPADVVLAGSDVEARVLARAVKWYAERRVLLNGAKTVVFA